MAVENEEKDTFVKIKKSDFDRLIKSVETLSKDRDTLFSVADKSRLARAQAMSGEALIHTAKVSMFDGKYIIGWKLTKNISEIMPQTGRWVEDQQTVLVFEDGETLEMPLIDFYRKITKVSGDIVSQTEQNSGGIKSTIFTLEFKDGKQLSIDNKFVN